MNPRHLAVAALAATALAAAPASAVADYGGETRDGNPIVLDVDRHGRLTRAAVMFTTRCESGDGYSYGQSFSRKRGVVRLKVRNLRGGRFRASAAAGAGLEDGREVAIAIDLRGTIRGRRASGVLTAAVLIGRDLAREAEDTCTYRPKSFRARRAPGRILTGETSQHLPVVMRLDRRARNVRVLNIGWGAGCEPPGFIQIPDELLRFRIRGGAFGDDFDHTVRLDDGTERIFRYDLAGRANRRRASGTIAVEMEDRGGPAPGICRTNTVRWRAS